MFHYYCLNPIASFGLDHFSKEYEASEEMGEADAILVRSAMMHDMELPGNASALLQGPEPASTISPWSAAPSRESWY